MLAFRLAPVQRLDCESAQGFLRGHPVERLMSGKICGENKRGKAVSGGTFKHRLAPLKTGKTRMIFCRVFRPPFPAVDKTMPKPT